MAKRDNQILDILTSEHRVEVAELSRRLGVSEVTVRKDLDALQAKGVVVREHGFATLSHSNDVDGRLAYHYDEKLRIARAAADLVHDGTTVMIESGSCCALLARELADTKTGVTIVTNSAFIASYVRDSPHVSVTLLGGTCQRDSQVVVGPLVRTCAQEFYVDRLFIGADGWVQGVGPTNADQMRADAVRSMAESAAEVVVLTESEKFGRRGAVPMRLLGRHVMLITDANITDDWRASLERDHVDVHIAG
jgi:DeoR/GlpR family transcriptional regulator of sugar metabolism